MGKGGGGSTQTIQKADPWIGVQGPLKSLYANAQANYDRGGAQYFTGKAVADQSDATLQAQAATLARARQGNAGMREAEASNMATLRGGNLNNNPTNDFFRSIQSGTNQGAGQNYLNQTAGGNFGGAGQGQLASAASGNFSGAGLGALSNLATQGQLGGNAGGFLSGLASGSLSGGGQGFQQLGQTSQGNFTGAAGNAMLSLMEGTGTSADQDYLRNATQGQFVNSNPYLSDMATAANQGISDQFRNAIAPGLASQFSAAGRTGSGASIDANAMAQRNLLQAMGNNTTSIYGNAYNMERGLQQNAALSLQQQRANAANQLTGYQQQASNQLANFQTGAATQLGGMQANAIGQLGATQFNAANALSQLQANAASTQAGLQMGAGQQLNANYNFERGMQDNAVGRQGLFAANDYADLSQIADIGAQQDQRQQNLINAEMDKFNYNQQLPFQNLAQLNSILTGAAPYASQSSSQTNRMPSNPVASGMGMLNMYNGLSKAGMFGGLGGAMGGGMLGSGVGMGMGGMLGAGAGAMGGGMLGGGLGLGAGVMGAGAMGGGMLGSGVAMGAGALGGGAAGGAAGGSFLGPVGMLGGALLGGLFG